MKKGFTANNVKGHFHAKAERIYNFIFSHVSKETKRNFQQTKFLLGPRLKVLFPRKCTHHIIPLHLTNAHYFNKSLKTTYL